jgi:hypothetical protein
LSFNDNNEIQTIKGGVENENLSFPSGLFGARQGVDTLPGLWKIIE